MEVAGGRQLASKWLKTNTLKINPYLSKHIPNSRLFNEANLRIMISRYGMVVIKPIRGAGGIGLIKIEKKGKEYKLTHRSSKRSYSSFAGLMSAIKACKLKRSYMIQRGINLATIAGRPIDYRVKFVKLNGLWTIRAMVGRLAKPGLFVTNLCRGGTQMSAAQGIRRSLSSRMVAKKKREMRQLTNVATGLLESHYPGIGQLGYDYGIDRNGHIWILEVNTRPQ
ncbi:YheC/YheD family protein [Cohnella sp.]|uniref:YheC/YheD family protein n=1 Tax=Cohnella sp. TaxID=1883426 RepID=UPI003564048B